MSIQSPLGYVRFPLFLALAFALLAPRAPAQTRTYVERSGPYRVGAYETLTRMARPKPPRVPGAIVAMDARLVDRRGKVIPQHVVMLHHLVFTNGGTNDRRRDSQCPGRETRERFWGTSEELRALTLPAGYGYRTNPRDVWRANFMAMHHRAGTRTLYLEYRVTVERRPVTPVKPLWLSVMPCSEDPQWTVPGGGAPTHRRSRTIRMPAAGRIVAAGGHLHGGAKALELTQPRCGNRLLVRNEPAYAPAGDPLYAVRPLLHEPDPKSMSWWQSATGWSVRKGEPVKVTASYDGTRPHMRVMGISHVYVAPPAAGAQACAPAPTDAQTLGATFPAPRTTPPVVDLTLARVGSDGRARPTTRVPGRVRDTRRVTVRGFAFRPASLTVPVGATVRWRFRDGVDHDVTVAAGPRGFASRWLERGSYAHRFTVPGTYLLQCSLHAAFMSQRLRVTR